MNKEKILQEIQQYLDQGIIPNFDDEYLTKNSYLKNIFTLDYLRRFIECDDVREVIIHSPEHIEVISKSKKYFESIDLDSFTLQLSMKYFCLKYHQAWNYTYPFTSFRINLFNLPIRMSLIHHSTGSEKVFIRKLSQNQFNLNDFNISNHHFFGNIIAKKENILISGSTGSGKTSFITAMLKHVDPDEHVIIMEDTNEIYTENPNHTKLLSEQGNNSLEDFCSYSMRMSPDRIILGEIRSKEVTPFLLNLNTGCSGSLASIHANNALQAIDRMALLYSVYSSKNISDEVIKKLICQNINYIIHLKDRNVEEVLKVLGFDKGRVLFEKASQSENPVENINLF